MGDDACTLVAQTVEFTQCLDTSAQAIMCLIRRSEIGNPVIQQKLQELLETIGRFHGSNPPQTEPCRTSVETSSSGSGIDSADPSGWESRHPPLSAHRDKDGHFRLAQIARFYVLRQTQTALHLVYRIQLDVYCHKLLRGVIDRLNSFNQDRTPTTQEEIGISFVYLEMDEIKQAISDIADDYRRVDGSMRGHEIYQSVADLYTSAIRLLRERQNILRTTVPGNGRVWRTFGLEEEWGHVSTPRFISIVSNILQQFDDDTNGLWIILGASTTASCFETELRAVRSLNPFSPYLERLERALPLFETMASHLGDRLKDMERYREWSSMSERVYFEILNVWVYCMATIHTTELELIEQENSREAATRTLWAADTLEYKKAFEFVHSKRIRMTPKYLGYDSFTAFYNLQCILSLRSTDLSERLASNPVDGQTRWVSGSHLHKRSGGVAIYDVLSRTSPEEGEEEYLHGPITAGPYPDVYFQELLPDCSETSPVLPNPLWSLVLQYDARLPVVRPVAPRAISRRYMPLYNTPVRGDDSDDTKPERRSLFGNSRRISLSVGAALLRGPNMHPQNIEAFRRLRTLDAGRIFLPRGCLLFTTLPETFDEATLRPGSRCLLPKQPFFLDPVAALHSSYEHVAHRNRASFGDPIPDRMSMEAYLLARRHVPLVVHLFGQGLHPEIHGLPIRDPCHSGVSEVTLPEGTVLESTVTWHALVDLGFMSSEECPYGTFWDVDFCRMIVCTSRVSE